MYRFLADYSGRPRDLRVARHPSESSNYFIAKAIALLLHYKKGLTFSRGLCTGREPAIYLPAGKGRMELRIEVGSLGLKKLRPRHQQSRSRIGQWLRQSRAIQEKNVTVNGDERMQVFWLDTAFLEEVAATVSVVPIPWRLSLEGNMIIINGIQGIRIRLF